MTPAGETRVVPRLLLVALGIALMGCEQAPDLVVSAASLDGGGDVTPEPEGGAMMEPPPPVLDAGPLDCRELNRAYKALNEVWMSNPVRCTWPLTGAESTGEWLGRIILIEDPAPLVPEVDQSGVCEALPNVFTHVYPTPDGWRLCAGYCKALGIWIMENEPLVDDCLDGGTF